MDQQTRDRLFALGCLPARILIVVLLIIFATHETFRIAGASLCIIVSLTFTTKYLRRDMIGGFGGVAWWHVNRLKHAALYMTTGILLLLGYEWAGCVLIADVLMGVYAYTHKVEGEPSNENTRSEDATPNLRF